LIEVLKENDVPRATMAGWGRSDAIISVRNGWECQQAFFSFVGE
jgi:hypothetical protein